VPVYNETVDEIVGIALTRELLNWQDADYQPSPVSDYAVSEHSGGGGGASADGAGGGSSGASGHGQRAPMVASIMEGRFDASLFVPESMSAMNALKQMRRQRLHMMVVVDEFGGTSVRDRSIDLAH
jgi:CBS domain containing-hemolysin-like protein